MQIKRIQHPDIEFLQQHSTTKNANIAFILSIQQSRRRARQSSCENPPFTICFHLMILPFHGSLPPTIFSIHFETLFGTLLKNK